MGWKMRRRKSQSPSSSDSSPKVDNRGFFGAKHKRRILRKRDFAVTVTEASSLSSKWSIETDGALWRVGKFSALSGTFFRKIRSTCTYRLFLSLSRSDDPIRLPKHKSV
jgi:hypothetical protein